MIRGALALTTVATIITGLIVTGQHVHPPTRPASGGSPTSTPVVTPHVSRSEFRPPLPRVNTSPSSEGTPRPDVHRRARPARSSGTLLDVTAYCATGNRTASGTWPRRGDAAVLNRAIPFGTRLHVGDLGVFVVRDWIGWGSDIDLFFGAGPDCERRASQFGRQHLRVEVEW